MLRDIVKKKKGEHMKMAWRVNPAHKRLHARLDQVRRFRRQHDQLRSVIVRVLRPATVPRAAVPGTLIAEGKLVHLVKFYFCLFCVCACVSVFVCILIVGDGVVSANMSPLIS